MTNAESNTLCLNKVTKDFRLIILKNIADNYGITPEEAYNEVTDQDAEHLFEYVTGPDRFTIMVSMI